MPETSFGQVLRSPDAQHAPRETFVADLAGELYTDVLRRFHEVLCPQTYLEIGCYSGDSLAMARGKAIAVDPSFANLTNVFANKTACHFYQTTSDAFFRDHDPRQILGGDIEMAFLDGMHVYEFLLRDFINTERACRRNSVIIAHDCLPVDVYITDRANDVERRHRLSTKPDWWAGDVWKLLPILKKYRPDLAVLALDAPPTGLVTVTNLDPSSHVLEDNYYKICAEFADVQLLDFGISRLFNEAEVRSTRDFATLEDMAKKFWI